MTGTMIDCTNAAFAGLVENLKEYPSVLAGYVTGTSNIDWSSADWAQASAKCGHFRYDQSSSLESFATGKSDGGDVENGAGTASSMVAAVKERQGKGWWSWVYASTSSVPSLDSDLSKAGCNKYQFIVANWNLSEPNAVKALGGKVAAIQWASPTSNPRTVCPGTSKTLEELNVDLNVTLQGWFVKKAASPTPPATAPSTLTLSVNLKTRAVSPVWK
jgi:hypothetical protein